MKRLRLPAGLAAFTHGRGTDFGFLVFALVFVSGVGISLGYTVYLLREKAIAEHADIAAMHTQAIEDHLTQSFSIVSQTLANAGDGEGMAATDRMMRRLDSALLTSPALRSISVLDARNVIVASSNSRNLGIRVDAENLYPRHGENSGLPRFGRPWSGRDFSDGKPVGAAVSAAPADLGFIPVLQTFRAGGRAFTLAAAINPDYFVNRYRLRLGPEQGYVEVLRYDGVRLLTTANDEAEAAGGKPGFIDRISDTEAGGFEETLPDGSAVLASFRASRAFPLIVVARVSREHALQGWAEESRRLLIVAIPTLLGLVALTTLLFVRLRRTEEQQAEARQREQDRLAATVFRAVDSGVAVADANDAIVAVNPAITDITGYAEEDAVGRKWQMFIAPGHSPEFMAEIDVALSDKGAWHGEVWHGRRNGERYAAWQSITLVHGQDGEVMYKVVALSDITDRKKAEEAQLRSVIEASPEAMLLVRSDGSIGYANRVCEQVFGYSRTELTGLDVNALVPDAHRARHKSHVDSYVRDPRSRPIGSGMRLNARRKNGDQFPAEISLSPMTIGGRFVVIVSVNDITQRIRDEEALRASEERWKFALEGAGEGVWDWNIATGETLFSKRILEVWGRAEGEVCDRLEEWTERIHDDDKPAVLTALERCLGGSRRAMTAEHRARRGDGRWHWALVHGMVVSRDADGKALRMIGTYADITERKTVEQELTAAKEAAEALLQRASMAERRILDISERTRERIGQELHDDLGQHLTGAAFLSEILFRKLEALKRSEKEDAAIITRLINDAVAKTRTLAQGLYPVELKEAGLRSMIEQLARNVERTYVVECEVAADRDFAVDDPAVAINLFRMAQEAINNAIRHGKANHIAIAMRRAADSLVLSIEDNGCGMGNIGIAADAGGLGMHTMRYRAALIGAELRMGNSASGGAGVVIALPLSERTDDDAIQRET